MNRTALSFLALATLAACAPAGSGAGTPSGPSRVMSSGAGVDIKIGEDGGVARTVKATPDQVWAALPGVYEAVGITGGAADPAARVFGNRRVTARRSLGDRPLSRYLNCGRTSSGHPAADVYRVQLSVTTSVRPAADGGSQVQTEVTGSGQDIAGTSTDPVRCASTGALEERIARLLGTPQ